MKRKIFALLIGAAVTFASGAQADFNNAFTYGKRLERSSVLNLGTVRAAGDGVVEIYSYHRAEQGLLLGSTDVHGGANRRVRVYVHRRPITDVLAVLKVDGQVVATKEYDVDRRRGRRRR